MFFFFLAMRILAPQPRTEPIFSALASEVLTIGPPGKSPTDHSCVSFPARGRSACSALESWFHQDGVWWAFNCWRAWQPSSCTTTNSECQKGMVNLESVSVCELEGVCSVIYFIYTKIFLVLLFVTFEVMSAQIVYGGNKPGESSTGERAKTIRQSNWDCVRECWELEFDFHMCCLNNCKRITCVTHHDLGTYKTFAFLHKY